MEVRSGQPLGSRVQSAQSVDRVGPRIERARLGERVGRVKRQFDPVLVADPQVSVGADHGPGCGSDVGAVVAGDRLPFGRLGEYLPQPAAAALVVSLAQRERPEGSELGEVVFDVGEELVENGGFCPAD
jgi:hypothetical protein